MKNVIDDKVLDAISGGVKSLANSDLAKELPLLSGLSESQLARLALAKDENELARILAESGIKDLAAEDLARIRLLLSKNERVI